MNTWPPVGPLHDALRVVLAKDVLTADEVHSRLVAQGLEAGRVDTAYIGRMLTANSEPRDPLRLFERVGDGFAVNGFRGDAHTAKPPLRTLLCDAASTMPNYDRRTAASLDPSILGYTKADIEDMTDDERLEALEQLLHQAGDLATHITIGFAAQLSGADRSKVEKAARDIISVARTVR